MDFEKVNTIIEAMTNCGFSNHDIIVAVNGGFTLGKLTSEECDCIFDNTLKEI